jgi:hypothetical protein
MDLNSNKENTKQRTTTSPKENTDLAHVFRRSEI